MAQRPVTNDKKLGMVPLDYTPVSAVAMGAVVLRGGTVTIPTGPLPAGELGVTWVGGVWKVPKDNSVFADGDKVYWDPLGDPVNWDANTGSATFGATPYLFGQAVGAALTTDEFVFVKQITPTSSGSLSGASVGGSTAAAGTTHADATGLPAGTASTYPVTGADDAKGVILDVADKVTGRIVMVANLVSNKILKVYPPAGGTINGAAADAGFSSVSGKGVILQCLNAATSAWAAW